MYKEIMISIIIIVCILFLNSITQNYTEETITSIKQDLSLLREEMQKEDLCKNNINESMQKVYGNWRDRYEKLAYYIEHDELEKVETHLTLLKSNIEVENLNEGIGELDACIFILEHIADKDSLKMKNIF